MIDAFDRLLLCLRLYKNKGDVIGYVLFFVFCQKLCFLFSSTTAYLLYIMILLPLPID